MMFGNGIYQFFRFVFTPLFKLYFHPRTVNADRIPKDGPVILAGNHKHAFDPLMVDICTKRTVHTLAKSELFEGLFGFFFYGIGAIPVYLDAPKNPDAYAKAKETLLNGEIINISPEAERNYTGKILLPFKTGAVRLAMETGSRILPYCIVGEYGFRSKDLKIVFGELIKIDETDVPAANNRLYRNIEKLLKENGNV
ncbi:MAG: 1-acyl-sn-glycerol-3-phosphate acyltransferase [Erysipelotrichaceae bacterium]|nr:1-acyl-sn-glycerol-3-phosphate acyltransferase [Erysipelotrichaceae bacterium]